jgi:ferric-dicitrate binding protein FerR (iron transport regulator)
MSGLSRRRTAKLSLLLAVTASVCLAQLPSSANTVATAVSVQGQVSILKDGHVLWAVSVGDKIPLQTPITTGPNGHAIFQVSDGSTFEVYPNSLATFRNNPGGLRDLIDLWEGRIRVHIEHLLGPNPNNVRTPTAVISVRGTTFDVTVDDDTETTQVDVEEGIVDVHHALLYGDQTLTDGQSVRVYRNVPLASAGLDKSNLAKRLGHVLMDAAMTLANRNAKIGVGGSGPGSVGSGCKPGMAGCPGAPQVPTKGPGTPPPPASGPGHPPLP